MPVVQYSSSRPRLYSWLSDSFSACNCPADHRHSAGCLHCLLGTNLTRGTRRHITNHGDRVQVATQLSHKPLRFSLKLQAMLLRQVLHCPSGPTV